MRFTLSAVGLLAAFTTVSAAPHLAADQQNALNIQNKARSEHGIGNLAWDDRLAASAQDWANQLTGIGHLQHSQSGQNLYMITQSTGHDMADAAKMWTDERGNYHNEPIPDGNFAGYGHFTQITWRSTQRVGMGVARAGNGAVFVVAHYDPPGNFIGQRPY